MTCPTGPLVTTFGTPHGPSAVSPIAVHDNQFADVLPTFPAQLEERVLRLNRLFRQVMLVMLVRLPDSAIAPGGGGATR